MVTTGACTLKGSKPAFPGWVNQDAHFVLPLPGGRTFVAVFDGHGDNGHQAAAQAREFFSQTATTLVEKGKPVVPHAFFGELFARCQALLDLGGLCKLSGTTATCALVDSVQGNVSTAHVGDSTLVLANGERIICVSTDHKLDAEADCRRVIAHGGEVRSHGAGQVPRVCAPGQHWPGLAMSRSLGDVEAHRLGVLAEPEVHVGLPIDAGSHLIVASDGIWDAVPREDAVSLVARRDNPAAAAKALALEARGRYQPDRDIDDITAVVVCAEPVVDERNAGAFAPLPEGKAS